ncbi:MAG: hypothetical protein WC082_08365 [Victivallales bacterium]
MIIERIKLIDPYDKDLADQYKAIFKKFELAEVPAGAYTIKFLEINGRSIAIDDLATYLKNDKNDFKKLMKNINLQLNSKELLRDKKSYRTKMGFWSLRRIADIQGYLGFYQMKGAVKKLSFVHMVIGRRTVKGVTKNNKKNFVELINLNYNIKIERYYE